MSNIEAYRQALARIKANDKLNSSDNIYTPEITNNSTTESYDNAFARTTGTALKVVDNVGTGVAKGIEKAVDFGASIIGKIGGLFSDSFEDNVSDFMAVDYTSKIKNTITGGENSVYNKLVNSSYTNELPDVAQSIFDGVTQGIGEMLPSIALAFATGGGSAVALGSMGAMAAGGATESALQEGNSLGKSMLYGLGSGAVEIGTELIGGKLFDSKILGVFGGSADDIGKATTKSLVKSIAKESFGEGAEEVLGDFVTPLLEKATIKSDDKLSDLYQDSIKSMPMDFIVGALTGSVMNGISTNSRARKYGTANANVPNIVSEAHDIFKEMNNLEKSGKLTKDKTTEYQDRLKTLENAYEEALGRDVSEKQLNNAKAFESTMEGASNYSPKESLIKDLVNNGSNNLNVEFKSNEEIQTELIDKGAKKETINGVDGYTTGDGRFIVSSDTANNTYSIATHEALHNLPSEERATIQQEAVKALDKKSFNKTINGVDTEITKDNWEQVYSELYPELSKESLVEEITNDYVGSMSTDYKSFKNVLGDTAPLTSLVRKVLRKDNNLIKSTQSAFKRSNSQANESAIDNDVKYSKSEITKKGEENKKKAKNRSYRGSVSDIDYEGVDTFIENVPKPKSTDSSNSIKNYANISQDKVYTKKQASNIIDTIVEDTQKMINSSFIETENSKNPTISYAEGKEKIINDLFTKMNNKAQHDRLSVIKSLINELGHNVYIGKRSLFDTMNSRSDKNSFDKFAETTAQALNAEYENGKETKLIKVETVTAKLKNKVKQLVLDNKQKDIYNKELYKTRKKLEDLSENLKRKNKVDVGGTIIYKEFEPFLEPLSKLSVSVNGYGMDAFKENIEAFKEALEKTNVLSPEIKSTLLPIADSFDFRKDKVTGKYIKRKLSGDELKNINKLVDSINKFNREYDEVILSDKKANASYCAMQIQFDTKDNYDKMAKGSIIRKSTAFIRKFFNSIVDPRTRFKLLENKTNGFLSTKLMDALTSGENKVYANLYELRSGINEFFKKDKNKTLKKLQEKHKIENLDLTNSQFVSLYMTLKNEDGYARLVSTDDKKGNGFTIKVNETKKTYGELNERQASEIIDYVETEFEDFLKPLKELWYNKAGQMYSDTLNERFGFTYENRKNYFHMNVDEGNFSETIGDTESMYKNIDNMFRPSFSKKIQDNKHSLYIEDIITSTNKFTSQLATFAGFSPVIDNVNKILRRPVGVADGNRAINLTTLDYLKTYVDKDLPVYLRNLLLNAQGLRGANQKAPSPTLSKVRGNLAKFALGANVKVMLTQTTSYAMAFGELRASSLARGLTMPSGNKTLALMVDNSPYFRNRFENNEATKAITLDNTASSLLSKGSNLTTKGIGFMDKQTIMRIFNASIVEIAKNNGVSINEVKTNKELLQKAIEKAEDVTRKTQPQYSALENGSITQSGDIMKSFLMYTSVSRKFLSQFISKAHDALHGGSKGIFFKTAAGLLASQTLLSLLSQMFKQFLGKDDDDKVFDKDFAIEVLENSTVNLIPVVKDIYNKFMHDYDLDVNVLSLGNDTLDVISNVDNLFGTPADRIKYLYSMTNVVGQLTGIPTKNITEYTTSLFGTTFNADWAIKSRNALYGVENKNLKNNIALDYKKGNLSIARANLSNYFLNAGMSELNTKSSNEVARLISLGYTNVLPTTNLSSMTINGVSYALKPKVQAKFAKVYSEAQAEVDSFISSKEYSKLDDENKARYIKKIYQAYYNVAKYEVVSETAELSAFELALTDISASKLTSILAHCSTLNSTQIKAYISRYNSKIQQHILDILG